MTSGALRARAAASARSPGGGVARRARVRRAGEGVDVARRVQALLGHGLARPPERAATVGSPAAIASSAASGRISA